MEPLPTLKRKLSTFPARLLDEPADRVVRFYSEHLQRDRTDGKLTPSQAWAVLHGLLTAGAQTYEAIRILLSEKRPKQLLLQAGVLNRSLFEVFTTTLGIVEDPGARCRTLRRESHKAKAEQYEYLNAEYGDNPKYKKHLDVYRKGLPVAAKIVGIAPEEALRADKIADSYWPTPGKMLQPPRKSTKKSVPFISGSRREVLRKLYKHHYGQMSSQAHGRIDAVGIALLADQPELQWNPGEGRSNILTTALLFLCCTVSELEIAGNYEHHPKLAELWRYLREINDEATELWEVRYEECLGS